MHYNIIAQFSYEVKLIGYDRRAKLYVTNVLGKFYVFLVLLAREIQNGFSFNRNQVLILLRDEVKYELIAIFISSEFSSPPETSIIKIRCPKRHQIAACHSDSVPNRG